MRLVETEIEVPLEIPITCSHVPTDDEMVEVLRAAKGVSSLRCTGVHRVEGKSRDLVIRCKARVIVSSR